MVRSGRVLDDSSCCLCGRELKMDWSDSVAGTIRKCGPWDNIKVRFCQNCVDGLKLIDFDERHELSGTLAGMYLAIENDGSITLKTMAGLNERMTESMVNSVKRGLKGNPLAEGFGDVIEINTKNFEFFVQRRVAGAENDQTRFISNMMVYAYESAKPVICPFCKTPFVPVHGLDVVANKAHFSNHYTKMCDFTCAKECFRFGEDCYRTSLRCNWDQSNGLDYGSRLRMLRHDDLILNYMKFIERAFNSIFKNDPERMRKVKEEFYCGPGRKSTLEEVEEWFYFMNPPPKDVKKKVPDRYDKYSSNYVVEYDDVFHRYR